VGGGPAGDPKFGLQREAFAEAAAAGVRRLLQGGQWKAALQGIQEFGLQREAFAETAAAGVRRLLQQGQWEAALRGIRAFGLQREAFAEAAAAGVRRLLQRGQWEAALRGIQEFGLASRFPPEPIIERLLKRGQWKAARASRRLACSRRRLPRWRLLGARVLAALWGIKAFGLKREAFAKPRLKECGGWCNRRSTKQL
jgi:hypothetical protein